MSGPLISSARGMKCRQKGGSVSGESNIASESCRDMGLTYCHTQYFVCSLMFDRREWDSTVSLSCDFHLNRMVLLKLLSQEWSRGE
jgi:hypothetical protein